jgi:hypothetical protein
MIAAPASRGRNPKRLAESCSQDDWSDGIIMSEYLVIIPTQPHLPEMMIPVGS